MSSKIISYILGIAIIVVLMASCKAKRGVIKSRNVKSESTALIQKVKNMSLEYNTIEIKGSAKTEIDGKKYNFTIVYRNVRNSEIWISVRAMLGIEVARLKCTPEEVKIFSRLAGIDETGDWSKITDFLGYPMDYYTFQGMMTRRMFVPSTEALDVLSEYIQRDSKKGLLLVPNYNSATFTQKKKDAEFWPQFLINPKDFTIIKTRIVPTRNEWQFEAEYGEDSNDLYGGLPSSFTIRGMDEGQNIDLLFNVQSVIVNEELKMPYTW